MKRVKVILLVLVLALVFAGAVSAAATWACGTGHLCPVVMHGREDAPSYLRIRCWDEDGGGEVTFWQIGGNDYAVQCE